MAMDGGGDEDEPARPVRGPDVAIAALAEQDVVQCCYRGKSIPGASSCGAAGASCSGAIARGITDSNARVEMAAKDGKSANCYVNPLN